ncbi:MAG: HAD family hydrolase [Alphaproteobacteria bacterium CG_4_9_14_3_um_filter_47_13]|nr:MAG: HAD family hydrolase [Alphaproteobacteria bacterium CG_4_9_14_3_um_filter_47_13]
MTIKTLVFDFDGVLVESVPIKGQAFVALYQEESPDIQQQVLAYHEAHGGVSRFDKIRYYEALCGRKVDGAGVRMLADRFSAIVEEQVVNAPWVTGAREFLEEYKGKLPLYVASATPHEELLRIIEKRAMSSYFNHVYGAPKKKHEALITVMRIHGCKPQDILMIGDALTDYEAAQKAGTGFIGRMLPEQATKFPDGTIQIKDLTALREFITMS